MEPECEEEVFVDIHGKNVNISQLSHIIPASDNGPRGGSIEAEIDRNGVANIIVLCSKHHKIIDDKATRSLFPVETLGKWKDIHQSKIETLFQRKFKQASDCFLAISELLDANHDIWSTSGPGRPCSPDDQDRDKVWSDGKKTILNNNDKIVRMLDANYHFFNATNALKQGRRRFITHAKAFKHNCTAPSEQRRNDYLRFSADFRRALNDPLKEFYNDESIYTRYQASTPVLEKLSKNGLVLSGKIQDDFILTVDTKHLKAYRILVSYTYVFTPSSVDGMDQTDPNIDAVVLVQINAEYHPAAEQILKKRGIAIFVYGELFGAIRAKTPEEALEWLTQKERQTRLDCIQGKLSLLVLKPSIRSLEIWCFGSYLRLKTYRDIDLVLFYDEHFTHESIDGCRDVLRKAFQPQLLDLEFKPKRERAQYLDSLSQNNAECVYR